MKDSSPRQRPSPRERLILSAVIVLLLGILVRLAYAFPSHKYVPDADSLNMGLRALSILDGDIVVFFSGAQIGALEAYIHAATFAILGASRDTISLAPVLVGGLTLVVFFLFMRELFGLRIGAVSLVFFAFPSPTYLAWTYMPNSYPETLFFCITTLWLAVRIARRGAKPWSVIAFGLSMGLGWWNSPLTLASSLPAMLWLVVVRRDARRLSFIGMVLAGALFGAAPWILYNLRYHFPSFSQVVRPVTTAASVGAAIGRFFGKNLPDLAVGMNPLGDGTALSVLERWLRTPAAMIYIGGLVFLFGSLLLAERERDRRESLLLPCLVAFSVAGLFIFSMGGQFPGTSVRYILALFFVLAAGLGLIVEAVSRKTRVGAIALAAVVILFNVSGYYWPWTPQRREWAERARRDERMVSFLQTRRVSWICGEYWIVYPFNFVSRGRVKAVPYETQFDFYGVQKKLPATGLPALVAWDRSRLDRWASRSGLSGRVFQVGPGYEVLLPAAAPPREPSPAGLYGRLVRTAEGL